MSYWGQKPVRNRRDDALARMDPLEFERLMARFYESQGYAVEHSGTGGSARRFDGGIDLKLRREDEYIIVQCKRENAYQVAHNVLHELIGVMVTQGATGGIVVNTGEYTSAALEAASRQSHVKLVDGDELRAMLGPLLPTAQVADPPTPDGDRLLRPEWPVETVERRVRGAMRTRREENLLGPVIAVILGLAVVWYLNARFAAGSRHVAPASPTATPVAPELPNEVRSAVPSSGNASAQEFVAGSLPAPVSAEEQARRDAETQRVLDHMNIRPLTHYGYEPVSGDSPAEPKDSAGAGNDQAGDPGRPI